MDAVANRSSIFAVVDGSVAAVGVDSIRDMFPVVTEFRLNHWLTIRIGVS